jgi:hypothetical protein
MKKSTRSSIAALALAIIGTGATLTIVAAWGAFTEEWQPMFIAPHDGSTIEIKNNYGTMPWYDIFKWEPATPTEQIWVGIDGKIAMPAGRWISQDRLGHSLDPRDERYMQWRPYSPTTLPYVDPTGGAQNTPEYWSPSHNTP